MKKTLLLVIFALVTFPGCDQKPDSEIASPVSTTLSAQENTSAASDASIKIFAEPPMVDANGEIAVAPRISCDSKIIKCDSLIPLMQSFYAPLHTFEIVDKREITPGYTALVLRGSGGGTRDTKSDSFMKAESFGVFIVDEAGNHVLTLDIFPTGRMADYDVKLGVHGDGYLVVTGAGSTYGDQEMKRKYFFDLKNRKLNAAFTGGIDVRVSKILELNGTVYCIGSTDEEKAVIARILTPESSQKTISVINTIQNEGIEAIKDARIDNGKLILAGKTYQYVLANNSWERTGIPKPDADQSDTGSLRLTGLQRMWAYTQDSLRRTMDTVIDGNKHSFLALNDENTAIGYSPPDSGIFDIQNGIGIFYPLPQPAYEQFRQYRPSRVDDGYTEEDTILESEIGPAQLEGTRIWFGLKFYDGEGHTGIGGIGSFDVMSRKFEIDYLKEIADSSVYSILVEPKSIWVGLGVQPEGDAFGTGIARIDRKDNSVVRYKVTGLVKTIARVGKSVYAGSSDGVVVIRDDGAVEHIRFSINRDGGYTPTVSK
ncbi:MAG: hypothetical protein HZB95_09120 [Nitrosomonadales bacterium]|nr:hypothetical protein [Nitrosomonadales bacterium]